MNRSMAMMATLFVAAVALVGSSARATVVYSENFTSGTVPNLLTAPPLSWSPSAGSSPVIADADPLSAGGGNYANNSSDGWGRAWKTGLSAAISAETLGIRFTALVGVQDVAGAPGGETSDVGLVTTNVNVRRAKFQYHQDDADSCTAPALCGGWEFLYNGTTIANFGGVFAGGSDADDSERFEFEIQADLEPGVGITASVTPVGGSITSMFIADGDLNAGWYDDIDAVRVAGGPNSPIAVDDINIETIPEPASLSLLALGAIALSARRRR